MIMNRSIAVTCVGLALFATPAAAGALAPTKPSQSVVLRVSGTGTNCQGGGGQDVDLQVLPDASVVPYAPPPGQALVITGMDWGTTGGTPGEYTPVGIRLRGTQPGGAPPLVFTAGAVSDTLGNTRGTAVVPNVSVAPGVTVCVGGGQFSQVVVHGFHTTNK
jgi:hypothetical protein